MDRGADSNDGNEGDEEEEEEMKNKCISLTLSVTQALVFMVSSFLSSAIIRKVFSLKD
jgi:hypothetical protein